MCVIETIQSKGRQTHRLELSRLKPYMYVVNFFNPKTFLVYRITPWVLRKSLFRIKNCFFVTNCHHMCTLIFWTVPTSTTSCHIYDSYYHENAQKWLSQIIIKKKIYLTNISKQWWLQRNSVNHHVVYFKKWEKALLSIKLNFINKLLYERFRSINLFLSNWSNKSQFYTKTFRHKNCRQYFAFLLLLKDKRYFM